MSFSALQGIYRIHLSSSTRYVKAAPTMPYMRRHGTHWGGTRGEPSRNKLDSEPPHVPWATRYARPVGEFADSGTRNTQVQSFQKSIYKQESHACSSDIHILNADILKNPRFRVPGRTHIFPWNYRRGCALQMEQNNAKKDSSESF